MTGVSVQDNADKRFHIKALPERRRGHRGRRDGGGMGVTAATRPSQLK